MDLDFSARRSYGEHLEHVQQARAPAPEAAAREGRPLSDEERRGYLFWGPVALAIGVTEVLGIGSVERRVGFDVPWPTISSTVGHLQERWTIVSAIVVGVVGAVAFHALAYRDRDERTTLGRTLRLDTGEPPRLRFYNWRLSILPAVVAGLAAGSLTDDEYKVGYAIYGSFALYGVVVPSLLVRFAHREVGFPTLFFTFRSLRARHTWIATAVAGLFAVLVLHLAIYPWPDITSEPARYAGLTAREARIRADETLRELRPGSTLRYTTQTRGVVRGQDAWLVFFSSPAGQEPIHAGCVVTVTETDVTPAPECSG